MIEGSGSVPLTSGSGPGSGRTKNKWIRIRIRIRNTARYICTFWPDAGTRSRWVMRRPCSGCATPPSTIVKPPSPWRRLRRMPAALASRQVPISLPFPSETSVATDGSWSSIVDSEWFFFFGSVSGLGSYISVDVGAYVNFFEYY